jgi:hypothetical protein
LPAYFFAYAADEAAERLTARWLFARIVEHGLREIASAC